MSYMVQNTRVKLVRTIKRALGHAEWIRCYIARLRHAIEDRPDAVIIDLDAVAGLEALKVVERQLEALRDALSFK